MNKNTKFNLMVLFPTMLILLLLLILSHNYIGAFPTKIISLIILFILFVIYGKLKKNKNK